MSSRKRLLLIGGAVVVVAAVVIGVVAAANGGSDDTSSTNKSTSSSSKTTKDKNSPTQSTTRSTRPGTGSTVPGTGSQGSPTKATGVVNADTATKYGQSPSSGTCAHWSERFINNSSAKVVQITFAPGRAFYSRGKKGTNGYKTFAAKAPAPAVLNVAIAPKGAAGDPVHGVHGHRAAEWNGRTAHRSTKCASVEVAKRRDRHARVPVVTAGWRRTPRSCGATS